MDLREPVNKKIHENAGINEVKKREPRGRELHREHSLSLSLPLSFVSHLCPAEGLHRSLALSNQRGSTPAGETSEKETASIGAMRETLLCSTRYIFSPIHCRFANHLSDRAMILVFFLYLSLSLIYLVK